MQDKIAFTCLNCKHEVELNIYGKSPNHCPQCLYSLHTDIFPGDNANDCLSLMAPVSSQESDYGEQYIFHKCTFCGKGSKAPVDVLDDYNKIFEITKKED